ncbi:hypothetical protein [Pyrodictium occultum]|uniref:hypothetical protein n=1 Tax=Pyrodictium occultum TaxID=2309 RepID=UPI0014432AE5|nr:hypothetical protein [Pyrodictium occultum]
MSWILRWAFDKSTYSPGDTATVSFWVENTGDNYLYFSDFEIEFDFGKYRINTVAGAIPPRSNMYLGTARILLPKNVVGRKIFLIRHRVYEYFSNTWVDRGIVEYERRYFLSIYPQPLYRVFVSRGLRTEDRVIGDPIVEMIKEWGFETVTIGVEVKVREEEVPQAVRREIARSDAVIAIATPRHLDALTGLWRTLEWLYSETGIAYGLNKPMLIIKDERVSLGGLPSYLTRYGNAPIIEFNPYKLDELRTKLATIMPGFREWIETKRRLEFFEALKKLAMFGLAMVGAIHILPGIVGALIGHSKK